MQYHWNRELLVKAVKILKWAGMSLNLMFFIVFYVYGNALWLALIGVLTSGIIRFSRSYQHYIAQNTGSFIELSNDHFRLVKPEINYEIKLSWPEVESVKFIGGGLHRFCLNLLGNRYQSFYHFKQHNQLLAELRIKINGGA
jgi:hypothetical protein